MSEKIDIDFLKRNNLILFETISGSKAYGLNTPQSDEDIKGLFILPKEHYYGLNYVPQVSDATNDTVYYEIGRFVELLLKNNPTVIELINSPENCIRIKHPVIDLFKTEDYLSKQCKDRFAGYALSQIKKAKGLKKKIHNPIEKERKTVLDFCYVNYENGAIPLMVYLAKNKLNQKDCGLTKIPHMQDVYGLYYATDQQFGGIMKSNRSNDITLSSIPKECKQKALVYFNKDGYSYYCKSYKEYWEWVEKRNEARYENTITHGKNYDAKNMMHTFRLLNMAKEIGEEGKVNVFREDRAFLLSIKHGEHAYDELINKADQLMADITLAFEKSTLKEAPNENQILAHLVAIRTQFYTGQH